MTHASKAVSTHNLTTHTPTNTGKATLYHHTLTSLVWCNPSLLCVVLSAYHMGNQVRNFSYTMADEPSQGLTSFDATNALWTRLSEAKMSSEVEEPSTPTSQLTSALNHFQFAV